MEKKVRYRIICWIFILLSFLSQALTAEIDTLRTIAIDSFTQVQVRSFDQKTIDSLVHTREFQYSRAGNGKSLYTDWLMRFISKIFGRTINSIEIPSWFWYLLFVVLSTLIIYKIFKSNFKPIIYNPVENKNFSPDDIPEDIHSLEFDEYIANALALSDYRMALRFHYLKLLKLLFDKELVQYRKEKSNHDYLMEIRNQNVYKIFERLTLIYEWVWYGKLQLASHDYSSLGPEFQKAYIEIDG